MKPKLFEAPRHQYDPDRPVTGNIYRDVFYDQGQRFVSYTIDCAHCGTEQALHRVGRHKRAKTCAKEQGWRIGIIHGKWICPACLRSVEKFEHGHHYEVVQNYTQPCLEKMKAEKVICYEVRRGDVVLFRGPNFGKAEFTVSDGRVLILEPRIAFQIIGRKQDDDNIRNMGRS